MELTTNDKQPKKKFKKILLIFFKNNVVKGIDEIFLFLLGIELILSDKFAYIKVIN